MIMNSISHTEVREEQVTGPRLPAAEWQGRAAPGPIAGAQLQDQMDQLLSRQPRGHELSLHLSGWANISPAAPGDQDLGDPPGSDPVGELTGPSEHLPHCFFKPTHKLANPV